MSTADARDRALEALLKRGAPNTGHDTGDCLDADTMAAWAEHRLSGPALQQAEAHMAGCERCQAVMATLVTSLETSEAAGYGDTAPTPSWWSVNLRWLVPLAGAAAAVLVWTVVPEPAPSRVSSTETKVSPLPAPAGAGGTAAAPVVERLDAPRPMSQQESQAAATAPAQEPVATAAPAEADVAGARARAALTEQRSNETPKREGAPQVADAAAPAAPPPPSAASPAARGAMAERAEPAARSGMAQAPQTGLAKATGGIAAEPDRLNRSVIRIASADASVQWRFAGPGIVERSRDAGATWERLDTGARAPITAGASPTADVCWLIGADGLVLLTTDGRTWRRVEAPTNDDLVAVEATSDRAATVRTSGGLAFQTVNGGAQWTRLP